MQKRRQFIGSVLGISATMMLPNDAFGNGNSIFENERIFPPQLRKGNVVGLIAPGYAINEEVLEEAKTALRAMGLVPYHTERILSKHGYFSNTDAQRVKDVNHMFANPDVDGILCARGGYGCTRIMHLVDYESIKKNPKVFIGFSDITALLNGIFTETGLITFHGPVGSTLNDPYSIEQLQKVVMHPQDQLLIQNAKIKNQRIRENPEYERYVITPGIGEGRLLGGSLTLINALIGTPHEIDFTDSLVCIEDVEEAPYRIDRMLTQLLAGQSFSKAAGILFGVSAGCNSSTNPDSFSLKEVIMDRIGPLKIPSVYGMSFGHVAQNFTFPIGVKARLNTEDMTLQLLERPLG
ncbi:LD-carboxypeptidase [Ulvibacterium sp.]|uniref:S66 peptidase family protein n=1 Tax=Ulvibacterium sp. TaxID=2665914 RepID=UPI0026259AA9|nr:LD-carboxypeptidase [Ulvibacterium sp.]